MGALNRHIFVEGFYEEDGMGDFIQVFNKLDIENAKKRGELYESDGISLSKIRDIKAEDQSDDDYSGIMASHFRGDD